MAMNLRLESEAAEAVRHEAQRTGRSQQDVIREAVNRHLGMLGNQQPPSELRALIATGNVRAPRTPYAAFTNRLRLPPGIATDELLDRSDRI